jgi:hypothetical protein
MEPVLVETAAKLAAKDTLSRNHTALNTQIKRTHVFAALDTLEFLARAHEWPMASLARSTDKPILTMRGTGTERAHAQTP